MAGEKKTERIYIVIEPSLRRSLDQMADTDDRSINAVVRLLLREALAARQQRAATQ